MKISDITRNQQHLTEMPIVGYHQIGNFDKNSSFRKPADRKIVTTPIHVERAKNAFAKTNHDFNMYFVNSPEAGRNVEVGFVDLQYLQDRMPKTLDEIKKQGYFKKDAINIIFTNNGGAEWRPMTPWIMAHRLGHALIRSNGMYMGKGIPYSHKDLLNVVSSVLNEIMQDAYGVRLKNREYGYSRGGEARFADLDRDSEKAVLGLLHAVGTMKSARDGNLRNPFEYIHEALAQFLLTGGVKFNPLPKSFKVGRSYYGWRANENDYEYYNGQLEMLAENLDDEFNMILNAATGHILVM